MRSHRLSAWLAVLVGLLQFLPVGRLVTLIASTPGTSMWTAPVVIVVVASIGAIALLWSGAWQVLRRQRDVPGLRLILGGACLTLISSPAPGSVVALALAILAGMQLVRLPTEPATPGAVATTHAADTPAIRVLFRLTLAASIVVPAVTGACVKIMLDRAGKQTLSWAQGAEYTLVLILPFAAAFVALAVLARRHLRGRLASEPEWVAHVGVPSWAGALLGAIAGGIYAIWPMMMNVEASIVAVLMPWWFAQWEIAGAAIVGGLVYLLTGLVGHGRKSA